MNAPRPYHNQPIRRSVMSRVNSISVPAGIKIGFVAQLLLIGFVLGIVVGAWGYNKITRPAAIEINHDDRREKSRQEFLRHRQSTAEESFPEQMPHAQQ